MNKKRKKQMAAAEAAEHQLTKVKSPFIIVTRIGNDVLVSYRGSVDDLIEMSHRLSKSLIDDLKLTRP